MKSREKNREDRAGVRSNIPGLDPQQIWFLACFENSRSLMHKYSCDSGPRVFCLIFLTMNTAVFLLYFWQHLEDRDPSAHVAWCCSEKPRGSLPPVPGERSRSASPAGSAGGEGFCQRISRLLQQDLAMICSQ